MTDTVHELRPSGSAQDSLAGYVEAMTEAAALGWVWCRGKTGALQVELRHGSDVLVRGLADQFREDLARSGVGSGAHAFSLEVPEAFRGKLTELTVAALLPDGRRVPLQPPPATAPKPESLGQVQRTLDMLVSSHRLMHRNLQAALVQRAKDEDGTAVSLPPAQRELQDSIAALEQFVVRIEDRLQQRAEPFTAARPHPLLWVSMTVAGLALAGSSVALWKTLFVP